MFSVKVLPYYNEFLGQFVAITKEKEYLAVTLDRQHYMALDEKQVSKCLTSDFGICSLNGLLMSTTESLSCSYSLFVGNDVMVKQLCQRTVLADFKQPVLYPGPEDNFWIYSVHMEKKVTLHCFQSQNHLQRKQLRTKTLSCTGVLYNVKIVISSQNTSQFIHTQMDRQ